MKLWIILLLGVVIMGCSNVSENGEIERKATAIEVSMKCPECGIGEMEISAGGVLLTFPEQYPHQCNYCDYYQYFSGVQYPYIKYQTTISKNQ